MTRSKASTRKNNSAIKSRSSSVSTAPSLPPPLSPTSSLHSVDEKWLRRRYDWEAKEATYKLMPDGFVPSADEADSYILLSDFSAEIINDIKNDMAKDELEKADIIINGTQWFTGLCNKTKTTIIYDDNSDEPAYTLSGLYWDIATDNGKTYFRKRPEDEEEEDDDEEEDDE